MVTTLAPYEFLRYLSLAYTTAFPYTSDKVERVPFYSEIYELTYNQHPNRSDDLFEACKELGYKKTLECFGGNGFESYLLSKHITGEHYVADIFPEYVQNKLPGLTYIKQDCINGSPTDKYDCIFIGITNGSLMSCSTLRDLNAFFSFCRKGLLPGGMVCIGYVSGIAEYGRVDMTFESNELVYHSKYAGKWVHWFQVIRHCSLSNSHLYNSIVALSDSKELSINSTIKTLCNEETIRARLWNPAEIIEIANVNGFKLFEKYSNLVLDQLFFKLV
jgi:hypothetical protein